MATDILDVTNVVNTDSDDVHRLVLRNAFASGVEALRLCVDVTGRCCPWHLCTFDFLIY